MSIPTLDLLYAHGCLADYAKKHPSMDKIFAERLKDVLNSFQSELKEHLVPDAQPFVTVHDTVSGYYHVDPLGGW